MRDASDGSGSGRERRGHRVVTGLTVGTEWGRCRDYGCLERGGESQPS